MTEHRAYGFHHDEYLFAEHPDPAWARRNWISLDGAWRITHKGAEREIMVPFPVGSQLSGVDFRDSGNFLYRRDFEIHGRSPEKRYLIRIGASDYRTSVRINDIDVGVHVGGYASFAFDITDAVREGVNRIEIRVRDSHSPFQARGKQTFRRDPYFVWYAGISGIWQSVWIEETGPCRLERAETRVDFSARRIAVTAFADRADGDCSLSVHVRSPSGSARTFIAPASARAGEFTCAFGFEEIDAALWSHDAPNLHAMTLSLSRGGALCDQVETYFGIRDIAVDGTGIRINGQPVYLKMALVQGYYPGGVYTPESFTRMEDDLRALKTLGYNGARIHEKVEHPYFSYLCDRLGVMTSFEMPSFYLSSRGAFARYESELRELILRDLAHPSCIMRMLFNETWGMWGMYGRNSKTRRFVLAMYDLAKTLDPTRPVIDNSGWEHIKTDIADFHHYLRNAALARDVYKGIRDGNEEIVGGFSVKRVLSFYFRDEVSTKTRSIFLEKSAARPEVPLFLSEYGGFGWYDTERKDAVIESIEEYTRDIVDSGLFCGYCYTQLYDVGAEVNGLMSFDRKFKVDIERVRAANC